MYTCDLQYKYHNLTFALPYKISFIEYCYILVTITQDSKLLCIQIPLLLLLNEKLNYIVDINLTNRHHWIEIGKLLETFGEMDCVVS